MVRVYIVRWLSGRNTAFVGIYGDLMEYNLNLVRGLLLIPVMGLVLSLLSIWIFRQHPETGLSALFPRTDPLGIVFSHHGQFYRANCSTNCTIFRRIYRDMLLTVSFSGSGELLVHFSPQHIIGTPLSRINIIRLTLCLQT